ncbi:MAG: hypothetical protein WAO22_04790 [bacterium]|nr:hypothetical protein [Bacillota bacterium]
MSYQRKSPLVYKTVQRVALPAKLECCARVRACPQEVQALSAELRAVRGQVEGLQLRIRGEVLIQGTLVLTGGRLQALKAASAFGLEFTLTEPLLAGHSVIEPQVTGTTYTVNRVGRKGADIAVAVAVTFDVNIKAAVTSLLAQCRFQPALLPVVQAGETRSFHRQLLLPLDPPGSKIVQAKINEQEPRVGLTQPAVVSGTAQEEILYLGLDKRLHELCHTSAWNYVWPAALTEFAGDPAATVHGEIVGAKLLSSGYTLSLSIREEIKLQLCQEQEQEILVAAANTSPEQTNVVRLPVPVAKCDFTELVLGTVPLQALPVSDIPGQPQVRLVNLSGSADYGQVAILGQLEVCLPYVDHEGKERAHHVTLPLRKILITEESRLGQLVKVQERVESIKSTRTQNNELNLQILCSFQLCLLTLKETAVVAEPVLATGRFKTARIQVEKLVGRQQQDFLLEQTVVLPGQRAVVLDHTVGSRVEAVYLGHGTLCSRGEIQLSLYCLADFGEEYCLEHSFPWQVLLNIPGTEPQSVSDIDVQASLLPLSTDKDSGQTTVRLACTVIGKVYGPAVIVAAVEVEDLPGQFAERPVLGTVCELAELEVLMKPRHRFATYGAQVVAQLEQIKWETAAGQVKGLGELSLAVTYAKAAGMLQLWQERRPFELSFLCPQAEPGQEVGGELVITEVLYQTGASKDAQRPAAAGQYLRAKVVLRADLVLL